MEREEKQAQLSCLRAGSPEKRYFRRPATRTATRELGRPEKVLVILSLLLCRFVQTLMNTQW